ncbi:MAG: hypothetical protein Q8Q54_07535 [Methylococcales bacterium]|nr:hypothetical protein [Methylococcales bacterium]
MTRFLSMSFFKTYALWLLLPVLGVFFGKLATTADPMVIGMGVSSFVGIALLRKPEWNVELVIVLGLFAGLMPLFFDALAVKAVWGVAILGFMLLFGALYRLITTSRLIKSTPLFIWVALLFFIYSLVDSVIQLYSAKELVGGFKRYYQVWGLMFGLCWIDFDKKHIEQWRKTVLIICLLQVPFCLYELFVVVPSLEGLVESRPELVPIDVVAGSFGASKLGGGNSAEMAIALIIMFGFLLSRYKSNIMTGKELFTVSLVLLAPLAMGETKIIIIFFPMMFSTLYRKELISRPHYLIAALVFGGLFTVVAVGVNMMVTKMTLDQLIFDTLRYNVYEVGYGGLYLNRTTVLTFWAQHQGLADPISFLFGNGLGSAQSGSGTSLGGHLDTRFLNYGIGFTGAGLLLWELGVFGVALFLLMMVMAWRCANQLIAQSVDPIVRADALAIQAGLLLFSFYPLYLGALFSEFGFQVIFTFMLGYLAWMYKQHIEYKS